MASMFEKSPLAMPGLGTVSVLERLPSRMIVPW